MAPRETLKRATLFMVAASTALAALAMQVKTISTAYSPGEIVFLRSAVHLLLLAPVLFYRRVPLIADFSPHLLLRGLLGFIGVLCLFTSLRQLPAGIAILIAWTSPVFTVAASVALLRERPGAPHSAALALTLAGLFVFATGNGTNGGAAPARLLALALAGAAAAGVSYALLKKTAPKTSAHSVAFYFSLVALVASLPAARHVFSAPPPLALVPHIAALGAAAALYQYWVARAYQLAPATLVAPLSLLTPLFGGLFDRVLFGQVLALHQLAGGALMLLGIAAVQGRPRS